MVLLGGGGFRGAVRLGHEYSTGITPGIRVGCLAENIEAHPLTALVFFFWSSLAAWQASLRSVLLSSVRVLCIHLLDLGQDSLSLEISRAIVPQKSTYRRQ